MSKRETLRGEALHSKVHDLVARVNARKQANQQQADSRVPGSRITGHYRQRSVLHNGFRDSTSEALGQSNTRQGTHRHEGHDSSSALPETQTTPLVPNNPVSRSRAARGSGEEGVPETSANARTPEDLIELINSSQARQPVFENGAQKVGAQPPAGDPPDLGASIKPSEGNVPGRAAHTDRQDQHSGSSRSLGQHQASSTGGGKARAEDAAPAQVKHFTDEQRTQFKDLFCRFDSGNRGFIGRYEALFALADLRLLDEVSHRQAGRLLETHFTRISLNRDLAVSLEDLGLMHDALLGLVHNQTECVPHPVPIPSEYRNLGGAGGPLHALFKSCCTGTAGLVGNVRATAAYGDHEMEPASFARLFRKANLLDSKLTPLAVDVIFAKCRQTWGRRLNYARFLNALGLAAADKDVTFDLIASVLTTSLMPRAASSEAPMRSNVKKNVRIPFPTSADTQQAERMVKPPMLDVAPVHGSVPTSSTPTSESPTSSATAGGIMVPPSAAISRKGPALQAHGKQHGILTPYAHDLAVCLRREIHRRIDSHHQSLNTLFDAMQFKSSSSEPDDLVLLMNSMPSTLHGE